MRLRVPILLVLKKIVVSCESLATFVALVGLVSVAAVSCPLTVTGSYMLLHVVLFSRTLKAALSWTSDCIKHQCQGTFCKIFVPRHSYHNIMPS